MLRRLEFERDQRAPAEARRALESLELELDTEKFEDLRLLISELVTNSVRHGEGDRVTLLVDGEIPDVVRCEVIDDGYGFVPRGREGRSTGGWGLDLVEQIADSWGVREGSTHVWFELSTGSHRG